jgi:WD40 repeat protein
VWNPFGKEILTGHGYCKRNLVLRSYPDLEEKEYLKGHKGRVLNIAIGYSGEQVASGSSDETLRFW